MKLELLSGQDLPQLDPPVMDLKQSAEPKDEKFSPSLAEALDGACVSGSLPASRDRERKF